jgi:hypothetical protein
MRIVALATFERGMPKANGGALKMFKDASIFATEVDGVLVCDTPKRHRLEAPVVCQLVLAGLIRVEE